MPNDEEVTAADLDMPADADVTTNTTNDATVDTKPVSRVANILAIVDEKSLFTEMRRFEDSIYKEAYPLRVLLAQDIHTSDVASMQNHMSSVERWREKVLRWSSLAKTFVAHCKSDHFVIKREPGMKITEFERESYQRRLLAPFIGLDVWLEGMVDCIDSRVNMTKVLLRLDESGLSHPGSQRTN